MGFVKNLLIDKNMDLSVCIQHSFFAFMSKSILSDTKTRTALIAEVQIPSKQNVPTNCHCFANFSVCCPKDYSHLVFAMNNHNLLVLSALGGISVWHLWIFEENFSGCKVDGDISLKQPYTFVCVFFLPSLLNCKQNYFVILLPSPVPLIGP